jgi:hypothetical protein
MFPKGPPPPSPEPESPPRLKGPFPFPPEDAPFEPYDDPLLLLPQPPEAATPAMSNATHPTKKALFA